MNGVGIRIHVGVGVAVLLQSFDEGDVLLGQHDVDAVQVIVDSARGVGVVEALDQRVKLVRVCHGGSCARRGRNRWAELVVPFEGMLPTVLWASHPPSPIR